ncbi:MAG: hypothetical protein KGH64_05945 [Candidatus Micrarchaeota archaeon]|nr:hypothetical protein [Candidatus Micrarchaeota archaeon]MDE1834849.1 hypothetical protein [Candidatus Micrarchaeota archaeon]MDE1860060.1 hypothetical protein [Candidatus Micrarchaeota archaeon]
MVHRKYNPRFNGNPFHLEKDLISLKEKIDALKQLRRDLRVVNIAFVGDLTVMGLETHAAIYSHDTVLDTVIAAATVAIGGALLLLRKRIKKSIDAVREN